MSGKPVSTTLLVLSLKPSRFAVTCQTPHGTGLKSTTPVDSVFPGAHDDYALVVATEDADRAREALAGSVEASWFLRRRDGSRVHAFETATAERLRRHAATEADPDGWAARDCVQLADLLDAGHAPHVAALFRHGGAVEGRTLAEWARGCGCEPAERL